MDRTSGAGDDATARIPREELLPPPPPRPDPVAPPRPSSGPPPSRRGGGLLWLALVVVAVLGFVAATYLVVDRAERDRPQTVEVQGGGGDAGTTVPTTTAPPPTTQDPASVAVVVLNGTAQRGWAGENVERLGGAGYEATAADAVEPAATTTVYVADAAIEADGAAVAAAIGLPDAPVEPRPEGSLGDDGAGDDADVVVVLGDDSLG